MNFYIYLPGAYTVLLKNNNVKEKTKKNISLIIIKICYCFWNTIKYLDICNGTFIEMYTGIQKLK